MRRTLLAALLASLAVAPAAAAHHSIDDMAGGTLSSNLYGAMVDRLAAGSPSSSGITSPNVEHLGTLSDEGANLEPGGRLVGRYFYVTGSKSFSIYDVADPAHPRLMSRTEFEAPRFENEDVATNGRILLYSDFATTQTLYVYNVRDKRQPRLIAELQGAGRHTMTCLLDCRFAYGSYRAVDPSGPLHGGEVVDLRNPAHPKVLGDWTDGGVLPSKRVHDVFEVAPGLVLTASDPMELLDTSTDLVRPKVVAKGGNDGERLHTVLWPRQGRDRFVLSSFETNGTPRCEAGSGEFSTWNASRWRETGAFQRIASYHLTSGVLIDGNPPANALGCSPHWFEPRPDFRDGGIVALGAYDNGTRFLDIGPRGGIREVGYFLPSGTEASAAYWITNEIVYVVDYARGIDIVRFKG
jgi:hypothetical protein